MTSQKNGYVLTVSVGNTNVLFGVFAGDKYLSKWRIETRSGRTADEYGAWLLTIFQHVGIDPKHVVGAVVCSVMPSLDLVVTSTCRRFFNVEPLFVMPGVKTGVQINYGRSGDLGPDRLANIVALSHYHKSPAVVVDFGTTTTFDVLDKDGLYVGGAIAPGVSLALASLHNAAPQLPEVSSVKPEGVIGKNIVHSMQSGCYLGSVEMMEGLLNRIWEEIGVKKGNVIATGGFAKDMCEGLQIVDDIDTNLTLKGLKLIYDRNLKDSKSRRAKDKE